MSKPTLYFVNGSVPSWRVLIALHEKKIPHETHRLRVMSTPKDTRSPEFLAVNPRGQAPVWQPSAGEGPTIRESFAILHALESFYPATALLPEVSDRVMYARVLERMYEAQTLLEVYEPIEQLFFEPIEVQTIYDAEKAHGRLLDELAYWESVLSKSLFAAGDTFTLADVSLHPVFSYLKRRGFDFTPYPRTHTYFYKLQKRESIKAAQPVGWPMNRASKPNLFARLQAALEALRVSE